VPRQDLGVALHNVCELALKGFGDASVKRASGVADWLEKLGLGQYAQRFAANDISFLVLD
jgi:hypothetical protein